MGKVRVAWRAYKEAYKINSGDEETGEELQRRLDRDGYTYLDKTSEDAECEALEIVNKAFWEDPEFHGRTGP